MQKAKQQGHARASSYPSSLPRYLTMGAAAAAGGGEGGRRGHTHRDSEAQADSSLTGKASSQALLSPFSPVFDLELEKRVNCSSAMERCCSEAHLRAGDAAKPSLFQQMLQLCRCTSPMQAQLLQQLQHLRVAFAAAPSTSRGNSPPALNGGSPNAGAAGVGFLAPESSMDIEAMACELLASGYLVQVRDGAQQQERTKTARSCLQNLRHRFIVCLGWRSSADAEPDYLPEPVIVEPRFREQFAIAHPTAEYEALLQAVPPCFVGSVANLETVVKLLCEQMVAAFKIQGLPVPPWRTRQALLSKWSPAQLAELAAKIANVRRLSIDMAAYSSGAPAAGNHAHDRLCNGARPAAVHAAHAAVGSAPPVAGNAEQDVQAFAVAALQAGGPQQLTQEQLMAIMPPEMQQQLQQQLLQPVRHRPPNSCGTAAVPGVAAEHLAAAVSGTAHCNGYHAVNGSRAPLSAVAGPLAPIQQGVPQHNGVPGTTLVAALPVDTTTVPVFSSATAAQCPRGVSPAAADVMALLEAAEGLTGSVGSGSTLKFTRKASAEWKNQRSNGRKMKGLLAAALKKSVAGSSRSNLNAGAGAADISDPRATSNGLHLGNSSTSAAAGVQAGVVREAANGGPDALIRRTHYRTSGDEPWRRITTVRWGAYAAQQAAQQQQQPLAPSAAGATH